MVLRISFTEHLINLPVENTNIIENTCLNISALNALFHVGLWFMYRREFHLKLKIRFDPMALSQ